MIETLTMPRRRIARTRDENGTVKPPVRRERIVHPVDTPSNCLGDPDARGLYHGNPNGTCGCGCGCCQG